MRVVDLMLLEAAEQVAPEERESYLVQRAASRFRKLSVYWYESQRLPRRGLTLLGVQMTLDYLAMLRFWRK